MGRLRDGATHVLARPLAPAHACISAGPHARVRAKRTARTRACYPAGFTLLELLVAITLMALLCGALYGALFIGTKAHGSAMTAIEPARQTALALDLLRQDFNAAMPPTGLFAGSFVGTSYSGTDQADSLIFYSCAHNPAESETACNIRKVELSVETITGETQPVLMRRITTNLLAAEDPLVHEQILCRNVKTLRLRYYDGSLWQDSWDSTGQDNTLPVAVEATLEFLPVAPASAPAFGTNQPGPTRVVSHIYAIPCGQSVTSTTGNSN